MLHDRETAEPQRLSASERAGEPVARPRKPPPETSHGDDFEPDPPAIEEDPSRHPAPVSLEADPDPLTPEQRAAEWERYLIRRAWPFGVAADELARAAKAHGPSRVWWLDLLRAGELPGQQPWQEPIPTDDLKLDWINAGAAPRGGSGHALDIKFGQVIRSLCPGAERFRSWRPDGARPWAYRLPPLDECRERFLRETLARFRQSKA